MQGAEAAALARIAEAVRTAFPGLRLLVVGDLMLDRYVWGDVERVSPEAPVPVLRHAREASWPGGAGNVAMNLASLGVRTEIAGLVGSDDAGAELVRLLADAGVGTDRVIARPGTRTTIKTRFVAGHHHVLRVDSDPPADARDEATAALLESAGARLDAFGGVILSDYAKGALAAEVCRSLIEAAGRADVPVFVDPKSRDFGRYAGATVLAPNIAELERATGVTAEGEGIESLLEAGRRTVVELGLDCLVLTRGPDGMTLVDSGGFLHRPSVAREVFDVTGAGDTAIAALAAGHTAGLGREDRLRLANAAAAVVVGKVGTAAVTVGALLDELRSGHGAPAGVQDASALRPLVEDWRRRGERVVFTNGCFDILHGGHIACLEGAAAAGDRLVVGINTDRSVRELKGDGRPVRGEADRAAVVAALAVVDAVVLFDEPTPLELILALRPDVLVKGGDYEKHEVVGAAEVEGWGGEVRIVPRVPGHATSDLIRRMAEADAAP